MTGMAFKRKIDLQTVTIQAVVWLLLEGANLWGDSFHHWRISYVRMLSDYILLPLLLAILIFQISRFKATSENDR